MFIMQISRFFVIVLLAAFLPVKLFAQAPTISYSSPHVYPPGTVITPLTPTSSGVAAQGYSSSESTIASGFYYQSGIATDALGNVYVANPSAGTVEKFPSGGGTPVNIGSGFTYPTLVAIDAAGDIYVADNDDIKKIPAGGGAPVNVGSGAFVQGLAVDGSGDVFISERNTSQLIEFPAGGGENLIGSFNVPYGLAFDGVGSLYVVAQGDNAVYKIPAGGGAAALVNAHFNQPYYVSVDASGNLFVGEGTVVTLLAGSNSSTIPVSIGSTTVGFSVAVDGAGNVYTITQTSMSNSPLVQIKPVGGYFISPMLPAGLSFSGSTGTISGTPTVYSPATNYTVNAYNSGGSGTATVNIEVAANDVNLSNLATSSGTLTPTFAPGTTAYTVNVPSSTSSITVTPTINDPAATVKVNGTVVTSGTASGSITLAEGINTINTVVTAQDGVTTKTYTLTVKRGSSNANLSNLTISSGTLTPVFATNTQNYTAGVSYTTTSITVTPTTSDPTATVKVNGVTVASGTASSSIPLNTGANTILTVATAQNGTVKTYAITVTRTSSNANLSNLTISSGTLTPAFATLTQGYKDTVANTVTSIKVTPATSDHAATVTVNGTAVASGTASASIPLVVGSSNGINIKVTAFDGTVKTYGIVVTRKKSSNANLANLTTSSGTLTPAFAMATQLYADTVTYSTASVKVTPTTSDATASVTVNGAAVTSGTASGGISLAVGFNQVKTIVTAQDGTQKTYFITVHRKNMAGMNSFYEPVSVIKPTDSLTIESNDIFVHQGLSPNGDGINDFLEIDGITAYPDNHLMIINRNGAAIFEAKGYDNITKIFDGHSNITGAMQLPGTYFYSLEYKIGNVIKRKTGFIVLKY